MDLAEFNLYTPLIQAGATIVLVCITAYYAWFSKKLVDENKKLRELQLFPHILLTFVKIKRNDLIGAGMDRGEFLRITNAGNGSAFNVKVEAKLNDKAKKDISWTAKVLNSKESVDIDRNNFGMSKDFEFSRKKIPFVITYKLANGEPKRYTIINNEPPFEEDWWGSFEQNGLSGIKSALGGIKDELREIRQARNRR